MNVKTVSRSTVTINGTLENLAKVLTGLVEQGDIPKAALVFEADVSRTSYGTYAVPDGTVDSEVTLTFEWPAS